jgi:hypothetical protein
VADEPRDIVLEQLRLIRGDIANMKDDIAAMRDEMRVQGAMIIRLENAVGRIERRLRTLEDAQA